MTSTTAVPPASSQTHMTEPKSKSGPGKYIPPNEVAWMFVQEYYTFVNKNPSQLHRFYSKNSSMVHGTETIKVEPCYGQIDINQKIVELDFQDCKVCISNVDSLASMNGGIIVQVLGELSNKDCPTVKFAQTFFLAEQPGGYYVLNDIFRYLKDEVEYDFDHENAEECSADASKGVESPVEGEENVPSIPPSPVTAPHSTQQEVAEASHHPEPKPTMERPASPAKTPATPDIPSDEHETTAPAINEPPKSEVNGWETKRESSPARPSPSAPAAPQKHAVLDGAKASSSTAAHQEKAPKTSGGKSAPSASSGPAPKQSWATLAANDQNKWKKDNLAEVKGSVAHVSTPSNVKSAPMPASNQPPASASAAAQGVRENKEKPRQNDPAASIYVKGVPQTATREMLIQCFSICGEVINCDFHPSKSAAFVDFALVETAHKAIKERNFTLADGTTVQAEEKRRYPRFPHGGRGGYSNRGGNNSNYNNRGGEGMDSRGGRGRGRSDMSGKSRGGSGSGGGGGGEKSGGAK